MPNFSSLSTQAVFVNGKPAVGAKIYVYDAGTNTPRTAYADGAGTSTHPHPFLTDANGCIPPFWITGSGLFKIRITRSTGQIIRTIDNIPAVGAGGSEGGSDYLLLSGGTMTGPITLPADPTTASQAATKRYVENYVDAAVTAITGGTPITIPPPPNLAVIDVGATTAGASCPVEGGARWDSSTNTIYVCHSGVWAAVSTGSTPTPTSVSIPTGFLMPAHVTGAVEGWVRANGRTIGNATSGATERANIDTKALFKVLWANDTTLTVSGGRGISSEDDFNLGKTIALPDYRARSAIGMGDMGNSNSNRLSGVTFTSGTATALGAYGGNATRVITTAQLPTHNHTGTADSNGSHTHTGTTNADGVHNHTNLMELTGSHYHTGTTMSAGSHMHSGTSGAAGSHTHGGSATTAGSHSHGVTDTGHMHQYNAIQYTGGAGVGPGTGYQNVGTVYTAASGSGVSINTSGDHTHTVTIVEGGTHSHSLSTDTAASHTHSFTSDIYGDHKHNLTLGDSASHTHAFTTASASAHTHSLSIDTAGSSAAVEMMQPFITCTYYIKL